MTRTTFLRLTTLHFSQSRFTEARTFITVSVAGFNLLTAAVYPASGQFVG